MKNVHVTALLGLGLLFGCQTGSNQEVAPTAAEAPQGFEVVGLKLDKA